MKEIRRKKTEEPPKSDRQIGREKEERDKRKRRQQEIKEHKEKNKKEIEQLKIKRKKDAIELKELIAKKIEKFKKDQIKHRTKEEWLRLHLLEERNKARKLNQQQEQTKKNKKEEASLKITFQGRVSWYFLLL